ncbi:synaptobrevin [Tremella mesenterica]|uniref:Protein transport protein BOS1 n=1 Tax=Tremella mesenterica TaxID=5217 RepID=A0A4V1M386_TREME|nr:synaptobrevin [Tremella mesenterica]
MNSLNALGNRHVNALQADLAKLESGESGPSVQGQVTTTLGALSRLIDDYDSLAKKEMVTAAREKAFTRVRKLKNDYAELKARFERAKSEGFVKARSELLSISTSTSTTSTAVPYSPNPAQAVQRRTSNHPGPPSPIHESPFSQNPLYQPNHPISSREDFALREHSFLQESENAIDGFIAQGRAALENIVEQRGMLKGTRRRLLDAANTLGLSRETISWVERRA